MPFSSQNIGEGRSQPLLFLYYGIATSNHENSDNE